MNKTTGAIKMVLDTTHEQHVWSLHRAGCTKLEALAQGNSHNVTNWRSVRAAVDFVGVPTMVCRCVDAGKEVR
jgi:hypothetical protein